MSDLETAKTLAIKLKRTRGLWRLPILNALVEALRLSDLKTSARYAEEALKLSELSEKRLERVRSLFNLAAVYSQIGKRKEASELFVTAVAESRRLRDKEKLMQILLEAGNNSRRDNDFSTAMGYLREALDIAESKKDSHAIFGACSKMGSICGRLGDFQNALTYMQKALENANGQSLTALASLHSNIGGVYYNLDDIHLALEYHFRALEFIKQAGPEQRIAFLYNNIGIDHAELGELDTALEYFYKAKKEAVREKSDITIALAHNSIGSVFKRQGKSARALSEFRKALRLFTQNGDLLYQSITLGRIAEEYIDTGAYDKAEAELEKSLVLAESVGATGQVRNIFNLQSRLYSGRGDYKNALETLKKSQRILFEIFSEKTRKAVSDFEARGQIERRQNEIKLLQQKIDFQKQELSSMATALFQKSKIINELRRKMKSVDNAEVDTASKKRDFARYKEIFRTREDWLEFKSKFETVHPDFLDNLKSAFPALTKQELRICSLIKIGLSTPMISEILFLSSRSVENHRYRLRKKLRLSRQDDIFLFLDSL